MARRVKAAGERAAKSALGLAPSTPREAAGGKHPGGSPSAREELEGHGQHGDDGGTGHRIAAQRRGQFALAEAGKDLAGGSDGGCTDAAADAFADGDDVHQFVQTKMLKRVRSSRAAERLHFVRDHRNVACFGDRNQFFEKLLVARVVATFTLNQLHPQ